MDGTAGSAGKKDNAEGTAARDITEVGSPTAETGIILPTSNGAYGSSAGNTNGIYCTPSHGVGPWTWEGWIKTTEANGGKVFMSTYPASGGSTYIEIGVWDATYWYFDIDISSTDRIAKFAKQNDGAWHYIAFVYDKSGTNSMKVFVDGSELTLTMNGGAANNHTGNTVDTKIEFFANTSPSTGIVTATYFDEWRFSNIARTATEISNYWNGAAAGITEAQLNRTPMRGVGRGIMRP